MLLNFMLKYTFSRWATTYIAQTNKTNPVGILLSNTSISLKLHNNLVDIVKWSNERILDTETQAATVVLLMVVTAVASMAVNAASPVEALAVVSA